MQDLSGENDRSSIGTLPLVAMMLLLACLAQCGDAPLPERQEVSLPNILWITTEDMSPRLKAYGDPTASTPFLDRLAAEGVRYDQVFSVSGVCSPSRAALITGMYPTSIGAQHMRTLSRTASIAEIKDPEALAIPVYEAVPPPEVKCFTEYLRARGYYCTNNSKTDYQFHPPVTAWDESSSKAHWRNRPEGRPFFSVFNITTTHESQVWVRSRDPLEIDPDLVVLPPYYPDTPIVRRDVARHYNNIQIMDSQVGEILNELEDDGLLEETIVFFFSDHGDGLPRAKRWTYDSGLRVPLIIRFPRGEHAGTYREELISFVDFAPTVLSLAGIAIPQYMQGQPFLGPQRVAPRKYVFAARDRMDPAIDTVRAVRDQRFKYIRNYRPERPYVQFIPYRNQMALMQELLRLNREGGLNAEQKLWFRESRPAEELYDTSTDPHEIHNLAANPSFNEKLTELRSAHLDWVQRTGDPGMIPEDELVSRMWVPDGKQPHTAPPAIQVTSESPGSVRIMLRSSTPGASIAYQVGEDPHWWLYSEPVEIPKSETLAVQAVRIGFKPSSIVARTFQ